MQSVALAQLKQTVRKAHLKQLRSWAKAESAMLQAASQRLCDHVYDYILARYRPFVLSLPAPHPASSEDSVHDQLHALLSAPPAAPLPPPAPLYILAYLPLYYEVDLLPLMRRLWPLAQEQNIHILAPVVLPVTSPVSLTIPVAGATADAAAATHSHEDDATAERHQSAMVFVEILDEADLEAAFQPQGAYKIREFSNALLDPWLRGPDDEAAATVSTTAAAAAKSTAKGEGASSHDSSAAEPPQPSQQGSSGPHRNDGRVRHMLLCDTYARLFPAAHARGYRPAGLLEYAACSRAPSSSSFPSPSGVVENGGANGGAASSSDVTTHLDDVALLILTPGVLFDVQTGRRLGKGGGFYDRFISFHAAHRPCYQPLEAPSSSSEAPAQSFLTSSQHGEAARLPAHAFPSMEVMAVAFDSQVLHSVLPPADGSSADCIPLNGHDQLMHAVASPSGGVEQVRTWAAC